MFVLTNLTQYAFCFHIIGITCEIILLVNGRVEYSGPLQVGTTATQTCTGARVLIGGRIRTCTSPQSSVSCNTLGEWVEEASECGQYKCWCSKTTLRHTNSAYTYMYMVDITKEDLG